MKTIATWTKGVIVSGTVAVGLLVASHTGYADDGNVLGLKLGLDLNADAQVAAQSGDDRAHEGSGRGEQGSLLDLGADADVAADVVIGGKTHDVEGASEGEEDSLLDLGADADVAADVVIGGKTDEEEGSDKGEQDSLLDLGVNADVGVTLGIGGSGEDAGSGDIGGNDSGAGSDDADGGADDNGGEGGNPADPGTDEGAGGNDDNSNDNEGSADGGDSDAGSDDTGSDNQAAGSGDIGGNESGTGSDDADGGAGTNPPASDASAGRDSQNNDASAMDSASDGTPGANANACPKDPSFSHLAAYWSNTEWNARIDSLLAAHATGELGPERELTRAEFTAMVVELLCVPLTDEASTFSDVQSNQGYDPYIATAQEHGWVEGRSEDVFAPHALITREEAAAIIGRIVIASPLARALSDLEQFDDRAQISDWARPYVGLAVAYEIMGGTAESRYAPAASVTRAEASVLLHSLLDRLQEK
ncbi:S-layer homology domain-containing protein [Paenibacillus sp. IB182496]|uniref:S-layer homology domain-containing protein n=1 Tax=Paenibacillus sabuli TaxID=2772509 RepID=A0A927BU97_9BACL|nr:S-layer homology domain-containing protein [Paenibacillus sabuli]MBD2846943.1 S-layer homology domain-containing protein [Paenibacillus sabuli]